MKRYRDIRIEITKTVFAEYASRFRVKKGWLDSSGKT